MQRKMLRICLSTNILTSTLIFKLINRTNW